MTQRYFAPELPETEATVELSEAETQHARHVMRLEVGDAVILFDGQGRESRATVASISRNACQCSSEGSKAVDRSLARDLCVAVALPKHDRARELIERLTELGVKQVVPLVAERSQRPPSPKMIAKLERTVIESCKQCERNDLLRINRPIDAQQFFETVATGDRLIAHRTSPDEPPVGLETIQAVGPTVTVAVGPEGGWTDREYRRALDQGFHSINLGRRIYRVETAATVLASLLSIT